MVSSTVGAALDAVVANIFSAAKQRDIEKKIRRKNNNINSFKTGAQAFEILIDQNNLFPLKENYVLIEMSYFQPPINLEEIIHKLIIKNYIPVFVFFYVNSINSYNLNICSKI